MTTRTLSPNSELSPTGASFQSARPTGSDTEAPSTPKRGRPRRHWRAERTPPGERNGASRRPPPRRDAAQPPHRLAGPKTESDPRVDESEDVADQKRHLLG